MRVRFVAALTLLSACSQQDPEVAHLAVPSASAFAPNPVAKATTSAPLTSGAGPNIYAHAGSGPNESNYWIEDPNAQGLAAEVRLNHFAYGRQVDVYSQWGNRRRFEQRSFVIHPDLASDGVDYELYTDPSSGEETLTVLRNTNDMSPGGGREQYLDLLVAAGANLPTLFDSGLPSQTNFWSAWPRNGVGVLVFEDLLDVSGPLGPLVQWRVGEDLADLFHAPRVDTNHGGWALLAGQTERSYHPTRLLLDPVRSDREAEEMGTLPWWTGMPAASDPAIANAAVYIPTMVVPSQGQFAVLTNLAGNPLATAGNGSVDFSDPTRPVVRAARTGGVEGDPYGGMLPDETPPRVIGTFAVDVVAPPVPDPTGDSAEWLITFDFPTDGCAVRPRRGCCVQLSGSFFGVVTRPGGPLQGRRAVDVPVRILEGTLPANPTFGMGFTMPFGGLQTAEQGPCFLRVAPALWGSVYEPTNIWNGAAIHFEVSEPVAASSSMYDALHLTRVPPHAVQSGFDRVAGVTYVPDGQWRRISFAPGLLDHVQGNAETYWTTGLRGDRAPVDLAGNQMIAAPGPIRIALDPNAPSTKRGGHVTTFDAFDQDPPVDANSPKPEWSGQHFYDLARGEIRPRPVVHFQGVVDRNQPVVNHMTPFPIGVQGPFNGFGSRTQMMWRAADLGLGDLEPMDTNLDVEGAAWSPAGGQVVADQFWLELRMGHAEFQPDEVIDPASLFPRYPNSGVKTTFDTNLSGPDSVMQDSSLYQVSPGDLYVSPGGTKLMPLPINQGVSPANYRYFTWRDTDQRQRAGAGGGGFPIEQSAVVSGGGIPSNPFFPAGEVRTIGLPLLLEFRTQPSAASLGLNAFDVSLMANSSARPYSRAFSSGGVNASGNTILVDPDLESEANGGFAHGSGSATYGLDNIHFLGALDFVTRVSRSHSVWLPAIDPVTGAPVTAPTYEEALIEGMFPEGTSVRVTYRGASFQATNHSCGGAGNNFDPLEDAQTLDLYGDHYDDHCFTGDLPDHGMSQENQGLTIAAGGEWSSHPAAANALPYVQLRLTFEANPVTGEVPQVGTVGMRWH